MDWWGLLLCGGDDGFGEAFELAAFVVQWPDEHALEARGGVGGGEFAAVVPATDHHDWP